MLSAHHMIAYGLVQIIGLMAIKREICFLLKLLRTCIWFRASIWIALKYVIKPIMFGGCPVTFFGNLLGVVFIVYLQIVGHNFISPFCLSTPYPCVYAHLFIGEFSEIVFTSFCCFYYPSLSSHLQLLSIILNTLIYHDPRLLIVV